MRLQYECINTDRNYFKYNNFRQSQCIFAVRIPGNTNIAPVTAHHKARQNLTINFDAGPLKKKKYRFNFKIFQQLL